MYKNHEGGLIKRKVSHVFMILNTILSYLDKRYFGSERKGKDPEKDNISNLPNQRGNQL